MVLGITKKMVFCKLLGIDILHFHDILKGTLVYYFTLAGQRKMLVFFNSVGTHTLQQLLQR